MVRAPIALDALWDIYALVIHNIKLSRERQVDNFLIYPVPKFNAGDKVVDRNYTRDIWDLNYDAAYATVWVMGRELERMDESSKTCTVNVQYVKITYSVNILIKYLPDDKASWHSAKYHAHPKYLGDFHWSLNQNVLLLYNILLLINCYIGSIAKTMNNIGISHDYFIRSLGHCISP